MRRESAGRIEQTYPASALPDLVRDKDPVAWSLESRTIAIDSAYLHGQLPGAAVDTRNSPIPLPPDYLAKGKVIADQRLALAGYRLGALLPPGACRPPARGRDRRCLHLGNAPLNPQSYRLPLPRWRQRPASSTNVRRRLRLTPR